MSFIVPALAALPAAGVVAYLAVRRLQRQREQKALARLLEDKDFELRFPGDTEERERPVTGRQTVVGRRTARR